MKKIFTLLFFALVGLNNINAATFSSVASGTWSAPATWTITSGTDADGIPDADDNLTINAGHTVILAVSVNSFKTLLIDVGGVLDANARNLFAYGNFTINGNMINGVYLRTSGACTLSAIPTLTNSLNWTAYNGTLTIAATTTITKATSYIIVNSACTVVNNGSVNARIQLNGTSSWNNANGSSLIMLYNIVGTGSLIASASSNTVTYNASTVNQIYPATYYNLVINAASTKSVTADLTILNDLTLGAGSTNRLNMSNFNLTVGRNWTNNANSTILSQGIITFNGSGTQTITRASTEIINTMVLNGSGTVLLGIGLNISQSLTINSGTFDVSAGNFTVILSGNLTNNGTINPRQGLFNFNGSGTQTISGASTPNFYNVTSAGSGTVLLGLNVDIANNLTISTGTFDVSVSNFTVNLGGNLVNNSIINTNQGLFNFNGSIAQTVSGSATSFYNVSSANVSGVAVTSTIIISNILTVPSGGFGTSGAGQITIPATGATTYARIGDVGGSLTGTGWIIESYINGPAPKGWQFLSSPINGNNLSDWDNDTRFYMSGVNGNDGGAAGFFSVRVYNEPTGLFTNITTTTTALTAGKGFMLWMADNTTGLTAPLIYNSVGTPNFGNKSFAVTAGGAGGGYNLVGNPYACPITYSTVVAASGNLNASFAILLENNTYSTDPNGGIIAPNQGFMCIANSSGSIQFTEASKNTVSSPNILRTAPIKDAITINVYNNINGLGGATYIHFKDNGSDMFDKTQDLSFLSGPNENADNIWTNSTDQVSLLKNVLSIDNEEKLVPLTVKSGVYGTHHISFNGLADFDKYNTVILEDLNSGKKTDLLKEQNYDFNAEEIGKEYHFTIRFSNKKTTNEKETISTNLLNENTSVYNTPSNVVVKFNMKESTPVKISVFNLSGQKVFESSNLNVTDDRLALPLQKENGLYLLIIQSKDQQITRKIIY